MRKNIALGLIAGALLVFATTAASALSLNLRVGGVYNDISDLSPGNLVADFALQTPNDATATLAAGNIVEIILDIANPEGDLLTDVASTIVFEGSGLNYIGGVQVPTILNQGGFPPASLSSGGVFLGVKVNSPNGQGEAGDVWAQASAFAGTGTTGQGPDVGAVQLIFEVTGAEGTPFLAFDISQTPGDVDFAAAGASVVNLTGATINVPEPGTALLMGLGLFGLAAAGRRES